MDYKIYILNLLLIQRRKSLIRKSFKIIFIFLEQFITDDFTLHWLFTDEFFFSHVNILKVTSILNIAFSKADYSDRESFNKYKKKRI